MTTDMPRPIRRYRALAVVLSILAFHAASAGAESAWTVSFSTDVPEEGIPFSVSFVVNLQSPGPAILRIPSATGGFDILGSKVEPWSDGTDGHRRMLVSLDAIPLAYGETEFPAMELSTPQETVLLGPFRISIRKKGGETVRQGSWQTRKTAYVRGECVFVSLSLPGGVASKSLSPDVPGTLFEKTPSGWLALTLEPELSLPGLSIPVPPGILDVKALRIPLLPLPDAVKETRAVGSFSVALASDSKSIESGMSVLVSVTVRGKGNFPLLRIPPVSVFSPEGKRVLRESDAVRLDRYSATESGYEGFSVAKESFRLEGSGVYSVRMSGFPFFDPVSGEVKVIAPQSATVRVDGMKREPDVKRPFPKDFDTELAAEIAAFLSKSDTGAALTLAAQAERQLVPGAREVRAWIESETLSREPYPGSLGVFPVPFLLFAFVPWIGFTVWLLAASGKKQVDAIRLAIALVICVILTFCSGFVFATRSGARYAVLSGAAVRDIPDGKGAVSFTTGPADLVVVESGVKADGIEWVYVRNSGDGLSGWTEAVKPPRYREVK